MAAREQAAVQKIILFYKYHALSPDPSVTETYRRALESLCQSLDLTGRILVGHSESEGINGTLAGCEGSVRAFILALQGENGDHISGGHMHAIQQYWLRSNDFFETLGKPPLQMTAEDFKWSTTTQADPLFPDLNIKLVKELISSGGVMSNISLEETAEGYLTPHQWHTELSRLSQGLTSEDTVLIDCRNTKEYEIGHFDGAVDPLCTTYAQFPHWVKHNRHLLADKKVLMYCTGGIRCEKASAFIRREVGSVKAVNHLKGGIHKYLETFGGDGLWMGRNFVFDGRGAASAEETRQGRDGVVLESNALESGVVVGACVACSQPYDRFEPHIVCAVCREPTLVCMTCQQELVEYHCRQHLQLRNCYFLSLECFSSEQLSLQLDELQSIYNEIAVGRRFKQKRKTLKKQMERIRKRMNDLHERAANDIMDQNCSHQCRNCGEIDCSGRCWGFYGLKRKQVLDQRPSDRGDGTSVCSEPKAAKQPKRAPKQLRRDRFEAEIASLQLSRPPSRYRNSETGIRVPPCCTRILQCNVKAKWCGRSVESVVKDEFTELSRTNVMQQVLENGLLQVNGKPVPPSEASCIKLKSSDIISRIVHWHEAPVAVPEVIDVQRLPLPQSVVDEFGISADACVYVCDKPASVPVHQAGPYLSNSLAMMVAAQEKLDSLSLIPLHRTDRVTSGLTLCCTDPILSRIFHKSILAGRVRKVYLAKVGGQFGGSLLPAHDVGQWEWKSAAGDILEVNVPVETIDPANGLRAATPHGKPSKSLFKLLKYDATDDTSLLACCPVTGRNHQLRVHLQWLGFPILNDLQYGGRVTNQDHASLSAVAVSAMEKVANDADKELKLPELTDADVQAARSACPCCSNGSDGIVGSFTPAQLLRGGHAIHLHALRYEVSVLPKSRGSDAKPVSTLEYRVNPPVWANEAECSELDCLDAA